MPAPTTFHVSTITLKLAYKLISPQHFIERHPLSLVAARPPLVTPLDYA